MGDDAPMRILVAPHRVVLDASLPVTVDLIIHNNSQDDGLAFVTLVADEDAVEATFDPPLGFLAAGTAARFRVELQTTSRRCVRRGAQWVLFAEGRLCERRMCEFISFGGEHAPDPAPQIDPQRKAQILGLAKARGARPTGRTLSMMVLGIVFASSVVAGGFGRERIARPSPSVLAQPIGAACAPRVRYRARKSVIGPILARVPRPRVAPPQATISVAPRQRRPGPARRLHRRVHPKGLRRAPHPKGPPRAPHPKRALAHPPLLRSIDVPPEVQAGGALSIGVASIGAKRVRIAVKLGPQVLIDRTLPAGAASLNMTAPPWVGHTQLLTVRAWVKNGSVSASGYATIAIVPY